MLNYAVIGFALLFFGGWHLQFGGWLPGPFQQLSDSLALGHGFLFRINSEWYGMYMDARFFDSPVIQWFMLFVGFSNLGYALKELVRWLNNEES